ncbi:acetyl-CoA synthetase-like protein [Nadsonia fulvescens var. elongata DSM 6958]|uniref:Acetyl-CoA synthetase-like protein n=1 Tax=Nadsonia fulvescens var. elongata DSM 6958 TaxID=857566 RepID=A0A1E3PET7_9ASCO|nr:acetyl-CoA synthetase-like protein [Nadsonia fulvescens var. elongata DSM 6958]
MKPSTVTVGPAEPGETAPRRNARAKDAAYIYPNNDPKLNTLYNLVKHAVKRSGPHRAMGHRTILDIHEESKEITKMVDGELTTSTKKWQYFELSPYEYISYNEMWDLIHHYGAGLVKMGLSPHSDDKLLIFAQTSRRWMQSALAAITQSIPIVTAYDTLGEKGLTHSLVQTQSRAIFTDKSLLPNLINPIQASSHIKYVIHAGDYTPQDKIDGDKHIQKLLAACPNVQVFSFDDIVQLGKANPIPATEPEPERLACIMYTSGSTGPPKGVVLTHANVIGAIAGVSGTINHKLISHGDRLITFLPAAHIFEFAFEFATLWWGATLGYGTVKTLTDSSVRNCVGDIRELKPTVMVGVAAVWESVRKGILAKISQAPAVTQKVFWAAYNAKIKMVKYGIPGTSVIDNLIFKKIKDATGGCLKLALNGGSALSAETQQFLTTLICPMLIGYGLTETSAMCCIMNPHNYDIGSCGELTCSVTVKLVDVPEANYFAKKNQGEVWIKGASVMSEYYQNKAETSEAICGEWFRTGDIGQWLPSGHLQLIDRKKNLVKTLNGEYIALEKLESIYRSCSYVSNICVYADENRVKPVGIIVPVEATLVELAKSLGVADADKASLEDLAENPKIIKAVHTALLETGKKGALSGIELILGVVISEQEWTPQNGFVTSAQKLQRKKILEDNRDAVEALYAKN